MEISIKRDRAAFLETVVTDGRYASADAVVDEGLRLLEERERKLQDLRATIDASLARGGANSGEDIGRYLQAARNQRATTKAQPDVSCL